jgi:cellulose synthase/poly-beta-1,6-N-acetylglucosamine synthase-like glycosyltransferase
MINLIITSYNEPKSTLNAVKAVLKQKIKEEIKIIVVDPFPDVENFIKKNVKDKRVSFFLDPGEGKSYVLNLLLQENDAGNKEDIFIFTDGDVYISDNALQELIKKFKDKKVGCVTGKPVPTDSRNTKYGYWAHFLFSGINRARALLAKRKMFLECSGYLFAIRQGIILDFPLETSEDSIIPYLIWKKGFRIEYANRAEVFVKNPSNWKDWINQKVRNVKAHENLNKIAPNIPRTKSLFNEIKHGWFFLFTYPKNLKELFWTFQLYFARLYLYFKAFSEIKKNEKYRDGWREKEINSTKPLD